MEFKYTKTMEQTNYSKGNKSLIISFILALAVLSLVSCGARKVNKSETEIKETSKTETATVDSSKTITTSQSNIVIVDSSTSDEFTISPIDSSKEMIVSGKKYKNAVLRHKTTSKNKVVDKTETIAKTEQKAIKTNSKADNSKTTKVAVKNIDKKQFNFLSLWWLLLLIPIYIAYRKYKYRILWV